MGSNPLRGANKNLKTNIMENISTKGLKLIGKGVFSKVYQLNESEVLIKSDDYAKECMSEFVNSELVPSIERIGEGLFKMEYFEKVKSLKTALNKDQYAFYLELRSLEVPYNTKEVEFYFRWRDQFLRLSNEDYANDLLDVIDSLSNYGTDISFEISPRNVAVKDGKLILLDCFFIRSQLNEKRQSTRKRQYAY